MIPRLFIVDDEAPARSRLLTLLSDILSDCPHEVVGQADQAQAALDGIHAIRPDIVLLDVQMPGMTGIELATLLAKNQDYSPAVIFISAYDEYAVKAFEVHALDYLLKPVRATRLADAIRRVTAMRQSSQEKIVALDAMAEELQTRRQNFSIHIRGRLLLVPMTDVLYLKADAKYVTLRTHSHEYLLEESLSSIEEECKELFVRVHRNALVARKAIIGVERAVLTADTEGEHVKGQDSWQVILRGIDDRLPISRRQWPIVKALVR